MCVVCITWIYTKKDFVSCALVVWNGTGICKVSCYQIASEVRVFGTRFEVNALSHRCVKYFLQGSEIKQNCCNLGLIVCGYILNVCMTLVMCE